jgi:hypothetical protein
MKTGQNCNLMQNDSGVANLIQYLMVTGVIMGLLVVMLLLINTNIMEDPANRLIYVAFTDIGNGVSTRMIDVYAISPTDGSVFTKFDIPDDIAGNDYSVEVGTRPNSVNYENNDQYIRISHGYITTDIALTGIGASRNVGGNTTGKGMNTICYNSSGVKEIEGVKC